MECLEILLEAFQVDGENIHADDPCSLIGSRASRVSTRCLPGIGICRCNHAMHPLWYLQEVTNTAAFALSGPEVVALVIIIGQTGLCSTVSYYQTHLLD